MSEKKTEKTSGGEIIITPRCFIEPFDESMLETYKHDDPVISEPPEFISITKWGSWHNLCYNLCNALREVILMGWVRRRKDYENYIKLMAWGLFFIDTDLVDEEKPSIPDFPDKDDLCRLKAVPKGKLCCLDYDILTAIFSCRELIDGFQIKERDIKKIEPVQEHLESLVPWIKWDR